MEDYRKSILILFPTFRPHFSRLLQGIETPDYFWNSWRRSANNKLQKFIIIVQSNIPNYTAAPTHYVWFPSHTFPIVSSKFFPKNFLWPFLGPKGLLPSIFKFPFYRYVSPYFIRRFDLFFTPFFMALILLMIIEPPDDRRSKSMSTRTWSHNFWALFWGLQGSCPYFRIPLLALRIAKFFPTFRPQFSLSSSRDWDSSWLLNLLMIGVQSPYLAWSHRPYHIQHSQTSYYSSRWRNANNMLPDFITIVQSPLPISTAAPTHYVTFSTHIFLYFSNFWGPFRGPGGSRPYFRIPLLPLRIPLFSD